MAWANFRVATIRPKAGRAMMGALCIFSSPRPLPIHWTAELQV